MITEQEIQNAFLFASPEVERYMFWSERNWRQKILFWKQYTVKERISEDIYNLTMKHPTWLEDCLPDNLKNTENKNASNT